MTERDRGPGPTMSAPDNAAVADDDDGDGAGIN